MLTSRRHAARVRAVLAASALGLCSCSFLPVLQPANDRPFDFAQDTLAFDNKTVWNYRDGVHAAGAGSGSREEAEHEYTLHCFAMSRSARQFFQFARFDPDLPRLDDRGYHQLVRKVIAHDPSETSPRVERTVIPGYPNLRSFSAAKEALLKEELGGSAESFLQRGNWRMVFPFSPATEEEIAESLLAEVRRQRPPVVHLETFPDMTINHAVLLYSVSETGDAIRYRVYDPNDSTRPATLSFDRARKSFVFPPNAYFAGGEVDVYEVYRSSVY
ncbi:MAG: hypothetical protein P4L83_09285 [Nevskia sp.]|nr:hypothetical protein [Nevskia sp.]